jgi:hypothetical protein
VDQTASDKTGEERINDVIAKHFSIRVASRRMCIIFSESPRAECAHVHHVFLTLRESTNHKKKYLNITEDEATAAIATIAAATSAAAAASRGGLRCTGRRRVDDVALRVELVLRCRLVHHNYLPPHIY